jgi:hypothetical protein
VIENSGVSARRRRANVLPMVRGVSPRWIWLIGLIWLIGALVACGSPADRQASRPIVSGPASAASPGVSPLIQGAGPTRTADTAAASPISPDALVALATADAAGRAGLGQADVRAVRVESREWSDRSLGCPRPGMGYAQAITPGYLIVVEVAGQQLEYHTDHAQVVLCNG